MKLLLASAAAALMASSLGASAADLAKKAPVAVDYVKVCDAYGTGFFYIPGTDTCLKIGGYVRVQAVGGRDDYGNYSSADSDDSWSSFARLQLQIDARSQTEYGVLRSFAAVNTQFDGSSASSKLDKAYIQWAGFTAGYAASRWDFFTGYAPAVLYGELAHDDTVNLLAYTFAFGNGVSATISVEDSTMAGRVGEYDQADYSTTVYDIYGGNKAPDIVGNILIEQGWGTAQVMAAAHQLQSTTGSEGWGFAVGGGVTVKLPMLGADDELGLQVAYADGALRYLALDYSDETYDFDPITANKWSGWSVFGGLKHGFSPKWVGALQGGYLSIDADSAIYSDYSRWEATASLTWTPVTNLDLTGFVEYRSTDFDNKAYADADGVLFGFRAQRNF